MQYDADIVHQEHDRLHGEIAYLAEENDRLVKALKYYANIENYYKVNPTTMIPVLWDKGYIAREVLGIK